MNKIIFLTILCSKIFPIKPDILLMSDDVLDSRYIHTYDINPINPINEGEHRSKIEKMNFCSGDPKFMDNLLFGLITDGHKLMKKCFDENFQLISDLSKRLNHFIVYNVSTDYINDFTKTNKYVAIRRAYFAVNDDYLRFILKSMKEIEDICQPRMKTTLDDSYYAEGMAETLALGFYDLAVDNFKVLKVPALIISTLKFVVNWNAPDMVQKAMIVVNALLRDNEIEAASNILVTIFGILLEKNQKHSHDAVLIAEKTKFALEKFGEIPVTKPEYKPIRKKFKFIIVHLPSEIRTLVWEVPRKQQNLSFKNKKSGAFLFVQERQRQRQIFTGKTIKDSGRDFLTQSLFALTFNQTGFYHTIKSGHYKDDLLKNTYHEVKGEPERWYFIPAGDGSFYIKSESHEANKYLYIVEDRVTTDYPRDVRVAWYTQDQLSDFHGGERWILEFYV